MEKHCFQKSTIVITLNRNKTHTTVQDSRAKTPIDLSVGTPYPSCQPSVKMPNRLSQPVKQTSVHCADLGGARVVRNAIDSGPFHSCQSPRQSATQAQLHRPMHAHIWAHGSHVTTFSQVNRLQGFGDNIITPTTQM